MGLKQMHEAAKSTKPSENLQSDNSLIRRQTDRILELETERDRYKKQAETASRELETVKLELQNEKRKSSLALSNLEQLNSQLEQARQSATSSELSELKEAVSELRKDNQQKSETIRSLNERIGTLSESDNVLKLNDKLKLQNSLLLKEKQDALQEAKTTVTAVKAEYSRKEQELDRKIRAAEQREQQASALEADLSHEASVRAENMVKSKIKALEDEYESREDILESKYRNMTAGYYTFVGSCLAYGALITLFMAVRSKAVMDDLYAALMGVWYVLSGIGQAVVYLAGKAALLGDLIPQVVVAVVVHWLLAIVVFILLVGGMLIAAGYGLTFAAIAYDKYFADRVSVAVALVTMAAEIFFADPIRAVLPVNLFLLFLIVHVLYMVIRYWSGKCKK